MKIAVVKELTDARVALSPAGAAKLKGLGVELIVEAGAGEKAFFSDEMYAEHATVSTRTAALQQADMVVGINPLPDAEWSMLPTGAAMVAQLAPFVDNTITERMQRAGLEGLSLDMIPRTTLAQAMDVLSSMAAIAGYKAVLMAATHLPRYFPMLITAAGSIRPAKVLVMGAGVAGLQAIATAKRLGAQVEAFDTRSAAKEEVLSLGAKFIEVEGAVESKAAGGYGVEQSEEFLQRQRAEVQLRASKADVVICTAQVRGRKAPLLLPADTVELMQVGSVVVDLAASTGGNCELTQDKKIIVHKGVTIIGDSDLAATMPQDASVLYSNNVVNFLQILIKEGQLKLDASNEIIKGAWITSKA